MPRTLRTLQLPFAQTAPTEKTWRIQPKTGGTPTNISTDLNLHVFGPRFLGGGGRGGEPGTEKQNNTHTWLFNVR
eukprot:11198562-Lingulodinium_polyedra.AAC.1